MVEYLTCRFIANMGFGIIFEALLEIIFFFANNLLVARIFIRFRTTSSDILRKHVHKLCVRVRKNARFNLCFSSVIFGRFALCAYLHIEIKLFFLGDITIITENLTI